MSFRTINCRENIVRTCTNADMYNSNTCIGYKIAFYRYKYSVCLSNTTCLYLRNNNIQNLSLIHGRSSLVYNTINNRPKREPCGTPV